MNECFILAVAVLGVALGIGNFVLGHLAFKAQQALTDLVIYHIHEDDEPDDEQAEVSSVGADAPGYIRGEGRP